MKKVKKGAKKATKKTKIKKKKATGVALGCCTVTGIGRDRKFPHVTTARCEEIADELGGNGHWVPGECAEP